MSALKQIIQGMSSGYSEVAYRGSRYGLTVERLMDGKVIKIFARELKGTDMISLNVYTSSSREYLKPCEMSEAKVMDFLLNQKPIESRVHDRPNASSSVSSDGANQ